MAWGRLAACSVPRRGGDYSAKITDMLEPAAYIRQVTLAQIHCGARAARASAADACTALNSNTQGWLMEQVRSKRGADLRTRGVGVHKLGADSTRVG